MDEKVLQLESEISTFINLDNKNNCTIHFEYDKDVEEKGSFNNPVFIASAFTVNPNSKETFLLKRETGSSKEKALKKILDFIKDRSSQNTFTVTWRKNGENHNNTSYFTGYDMLDVTEKFYDGKSRTQYSVYEIKMNSIA